MSARAVRSTINILLDYLTVNKAITRDVARPVFRAGMPFQTSELFEALDYGVRNLGRTVGLDFPSLVCYPKASKTKQIKSDIFILTC